ncbi:MAG: ABC transporter substrate-binding protein [Alphaproteobacteria bacterium]|nr:ABC transporter substrate-binding protein [Alphaproteobacteria bacterium]
MKWTVLGAVVSAIVLAGLPAGAAEPIRIGVDGPFTGGSAPMGIDMLHGIELAASEINKAGGVLGRRLVLVERDDQANNDRGARIAKELTERHLIDAAVGYVNTGVALAAIPYYEQARIPVVLSVTTGSQLTRLFAPPEYAENYIFRVSCSTALEVQKIVEIVKARGYRKISIFTDTTAYGQVGRHDLIKALAAQGLAPISNEKFNIGDTDMTPQLKRAHAAGADVILTYGIGPELAGIANSRAKIGWMVPMIGSWTLSMSNFIDRAGANGEGTIMPQTFIGQGNTPKRAAFIEAFHAAYKVTRMASPPSAAQGYDSLYLLAAAIQQAGSVNGPKVRAALDDLHHKVEGVVKVYDHPFSPANHEAISAADVVYGVIRNGRVVRLTTDVPAMPETQAAVAK